MGRTPDHVAGFFCGYAAKPEVFAKADKKFGENVNAALRRPARQPPLHHLRDRPAADRPLQSPRTSRAIPTLYAGVVKERDDGIVISGAQQLATGGIYSDWLHLSCIQPLPARRRELRQRPGGADQRAWAQALSPPRRSRCRREQLRLSAHRPLRRNRFSGGARQRVRALGARVHLPQRRDLPRPVVEDAGAHPTATTRRRCATPPSCAS